MPKKKFSETKVGRFLIKAGSTIGEALPKSGYLGVLRGLIADDIAEMQEISKRWESDMKSDSYLSKNTRPLALLFLTVSMVFLIVLDSLNIDFGVSEEWIDLLKSLLITVYVAYFGSRGVEKFKAIGK